MKIKGSKNILVALLLAFAMLLACVPFTMFGTASADDDLPDYSEIFDMSEVGTFYYITDSAEYKDLFDSLGLSYVLYQYSADSTYNYSDYLWQLYLNGIISDMHNAYVILEVSSGLLYGDNGYEIEENLDEFSGYLYNIFSELKGNNCTNMFICSTEEYLFLSYNSFLDYVDIHINTDVLSVFTKSIFNDVYDDCKLRDCTFIIDANFSGDIQHFGVEESWFFKYYFFPMLRLKLLEENDNGYEIDMTKGEITREYDITIYCQSAVNSDMYFMLDAEENEYGIYDLVVYHGVYDYELLEDSAEIYLIGEVFGDQFEGDSWINAMVELFEGQGMLPTSTYLYGQPDLFWVPLYFSVYAAESQTGFIPFIICQFLLGEDLSAYDNNDGRCIISYKDINLSEDGWMDLFDFSSGEGFPLSLLFI